MLDIRTLSIIMSAVYLISSVMVFFTYKQYPKLKGPRDWTIGFALISVGLTLIFLRDVISPFLSIFLANALLIVSHGIMYLGISKHLERTPNYEFIGVVCITMVLLFAVLYNNEQVLNIRIHISNTAHAIFFVASAFLLINQYQKTKSSAHLLPGIGFTILALTMIMRSLFILIKQETYINLMEESSTTSIHFFLIIIGQLIITFGLLMLISQQLREGITLALNKEKDARLEQSNFWGMVSHEFKTPMGTILNSAELIDSLEKNINPLSKDAVKRIHRATLRLSRLVDQSLVNEWTNASADNLRQVEFSLAEALENLSFEYDITYHKRISEFDDCTIIGDPFLLSTAISSLLDNAIKYTNNRESCSISLCRPNGNELQVDVYNEGEEIPQKERSRIFEKFYRAKQHETISGSGFGLYIAKKILDYHNAKIELMSNQERTIFRFTIDQELKI
ncbi:MAG: HAMP domain-containing histidine kinase [Methylocystaceae bacterium]|nr:HAMP domain-containing histidine kinase [Methylocystaceae bacterium]